MQLEHTWFMQNWQKILFVNMPPIQTRNLLVHVWHVSCRLSLVSNLKFLLISYKCFYFAARLNSLLLNLDRSSL